MGKNLADGLTDWLAVCISKKTKTNRSPYTSNDKPLALGMYEYKCNKRPLLHLIDVMSRLADMLAFHHTRTYNLPFYLPTYNKATNWHPITNDVWLFVLVSFLVVWNKNIIFISRPLFDRLKYQKKKQIIIENLWITYWEKNTIWYRLVGDGGGGGVAVIINQFMSAANKGIHPCARLESQQPAANSALSNNIYHR